MRRAFSDHESPHFYQRLLVAGKPRKVVLIALSRKPPVILNALLKSASPWHDLMPLDVGLVA